MDNTKNKEPYPTPTGYWRIPGFAGRFQSREAALDAIASASREAKSPLNDPYSKAYYARMAKQEPEQEVSNDD